MTDFQDVVRMRHALNQYQGVHLARKYTGIRYQQRRWGHCAAKVLYFHIEADCIVGEPTRIQDYHIALNSAGVETKSA